MNHLRYRSTPQTDDVESLQTDIMRFMAIIGFCLMVIFAVVQSFPTEGQSQAPVIVSEDVIEAQIESLVRHALDMRNTIAALTIDSHTAQQQVSGLKERLLRHEQENEWVKNELEQQSIALVTVRAKLQNQAQEGARILARIEAIQAQVSQTTVPKETQQAPSDIETAQTLILQNNSTVNGANDGVITRQASAQEEEGLYLEFSSDQAFLTLLKQKELRFFVKTQGTYFEFTSDRKVLITDVAGELYEMASHTLPQQLKNNVRQRMTLTHNATYSVLLSPNIRAQINKLIMQHQSGVVIINEKGKVIHQATRELPSN